MPVGPAGTNSTLGAVTSTSPRASASSQVGPIDGYAERLLRVDVEPCLQRGHGGLLVDTDGREVHDRVDLDGPGHRGLVGEPGNAEDLAGLPRALLTPTVQGDLGTIGDPRNWEGSRAVRRRPARIASRTGGRSSFTRPVPAAGSAWRSGCIRGERGADQHGVGTQGGVQDRGGPAGLRPDVSAREASKRSR